MPERPNIAHGAYAIAATIGLALCLPTSAVARILDGARITCHELDNGVRVIVKPEHDAPVVAICAVVRGGSSVETQGEYGLAHVLEHMVFQRPEADTPVGLLPFTVERNGGEVLAETGRDSTTYTITVAPEGFEESLGALAQALIEPIIEPRRLTAELSIMQKELDEVYTRPMTAVRDAAYTALYGGAPYGHSPGGGPGPLAAFLPGDVSAFHAKHYCGANLSITIVGDVDPAKALDIARSRFGPLPRGEATVPPPSPVPEARQREVPCPLGSGAAPMVALAWPAPSMESPRDVLATDVLLSLLDHGPTSRLYEETPRLAPDATAWGGGYLTQRLPGVAYLWCSGAGSQEDMLAALHGVVRNLRTSPPDEDECRRAALGARLQHATSCDTYTGQADTLGFYEAVADYTFGVEYEDAVLTITPEDILNLTTRYFNSDAALVIRTHEWRPNP